MPSDPRSFRSRQVSSLDDLGIPATATGWLMVVAMAVTAVQYLAFPVLVAGVGSPAWSGTFEFDPSRPALVWTWLTSVFAHGGVLHLGVNLAVLGLYGRWVEAEIGPRGMLTVFFLAALGSHLFHLGEAALGVYAGPELGASGGTIGVFGWLCAAHPRAETDVLGTGATVRAWIPLAVVALASAGTYLLVGPAAYGIHHGGHLGGLLVGVALGSVYYWRREDRASATG